MSFDIGAILVITVIVNKFYTYARTSKIFRKFLFYTLPLKYVLKKELFHKNEWSKAFILEENRMKFSKPLLLQ